MKMNKGLILENVAKGVWEVDFDMWGLGKSEVSGEKYIIHNVMHEGDDLIEVAYPEQEDIIKLREDSKEAKLHGKPLEVIEHAKWLIVDRLSDVEINDIYDYDADPVVLVNGVIL